MTGTPLAALTLMLAVSLLAGCKADTPSAAPTAATSPSATATATVAVPSPSPSPTATAAGTPTAEGTVDPLGAGQQSPWMVKSNPDPLSGIVTVTALRMGVHPELGGWERIVFEFAGPALPPAVIQYVPGATACGSGQPVVVPGSAVLEVAITQAQAHDNQGNATLPQQVAGPGGTVINSGASSCDFEGHVTWDFGLNGKHNFKVTTLTSPTRLVIDIKQ